MSNVITNKLIELFDAVKAKFEAPAVVTPPAVAAPVVAASTPVIYKTKDGVEISVEQAGDKPAAGDKVTIAGAPAPMADYVLEDGTTICVDETGTVTACNDAFPAAPTDPAAPSMPEMDMKTLCTELAARVTALETELAKVRQPVTQMEEVPVLMAKMEKQDEIIKDTFALIGEIIKQPTVEPKTVPSAKKEKFQKENEKLQSKFEKIGEAVKDIKKY